jgi:hypothetical protein
MRALAHLPGVAYAAPDDTLLELSADRMAFKRKDLFATWKKGPLLLQEIAARTISTNLSTFDLTGLPAHLKSLILKALLRSEKAVADTLEHLDILLDEDTTEIDFSNAPALPGPWVPRFAACTGLIRLDLRGCLGVKSFSLSLLF